MSANKQGYTPKEIESIVRQIYPEKPEAELEKELRRVDAMSIGDFNTWLIGAHLTLKGMMG